MTIAEWIVYLAMIYAAVGVLFAIAFIALGVGRMDAAAKGAPLAFRLLILPGITYSGTTLATMPEQNGNCSRK